MPTIHFLNVKEGDCSIIQHYSDRVTVIDVCNVKNISSSTTSELNLAHRLKVLMTPDSPKGGNFNQKAYPVNPIEYMDSRNISEVFRYIQTHPDMDHMDGIKAFFEHFSPINFWDTDNNKEMASWEGSPYSSSDWYFYRGLRDSNPPENPKRLTLLSGQKGQYWNREEGDPGGDGLHILAPTQELVNAANEGSDDYNDCSYVILYRTDGMKVIFAGDSHDKTWEHILSNHSNDVKDIDLLIAPHHGRKSARDYSFLDVLRPSLTFFGNARSEHLAYGAWNYRDLPYVTNNQVDCMVVKTGESTWDFYVTNKKYAKQRNPWTFFSNDLQAWYLKTFKVRNAS